MRKLLCLAAAGVCLLFVSAAHADSTYNLTLNETYGDVGGGTGSFTINAPPSTGINSQSIYYASSTVGNILESLSFSIGGDMFSLADANMGSLPNTYVQFTSGLLDAVNYAGNEDTNTVILSLAASGLTYSYFDSQGTLYSDGNITATLQPPSAAVTPEPSSLVLLGTGLLGACGVLRRRYA